MDDSHNISQTKKVDGPCGRCVGRSNNNANANGGLVYSNAHYASSYSHAYSGSRLAFKSEELAEYAGKQFAELFADFCFLPKDNND